MTSRGTFQPWPLSEYDDDINTYKLLTSNTVLWRCTEGKQNENQLAENVS